MTAAMPKTSEEWAALPHWLRREYELLKARRDAENPNLNFKTALRAQERMERVDAFPSDVRAVVYEHGLELVQEFWNHGVKKGKSILYLIDCVRNIERRDGVPIQKFRPNVKKNQAANPLDRVVTVPLEPTDEMIAASMTTVSNFDVSVTKREKHRRRLRAALLVCKRGDQK